MESHPQNPELRDNPESCHTRILETFKQVLWQTVKTQMKCHIRRHFIWVSTVSGTEIHNFIEILTVNTLYEMGNSILVLSTCMEKSTRKITVELFLDIGNYE